jgi:hypothetical protein
MKARAQFGHEAADPLRLDDRGRHPHSFRSSALSGISIDKTLAASKRIRRAKKFWRLESFAAARTSLTLSTRMERLADDKDPIMQRITLVRYSAKPEKADENERLSRAVFAELREKNPEGVAYALFRDGVDFVHLFVNSRDDDSSAITELPTFKAFSKDVESRCTTPPQPMRLSLDLVESHGLARAPA